ncbi:MAG: DNA translocase FtsK [Candidatus Omnitrophota bacterium]
MDEVRKNEIIAVLLFAISFFLFLSIVTFNELDLSFYTSSPNGVLHNATGVIGACVGGFLLFFVGKAAYVMPILILIWGIARLFQVKTRKFYFKLIGTIVLITAVSASLSMMSDVSATLAFMNGGLIGSIVSAFLLEYLGKGGAIVFVSAFIVLSVLIATEFLILPVITISIGFFLKSLNNFYSWVLGKVRLWTEKMKTSGDTIKNAKEEVAKKLERMKKQVYEARRNSIPGNIEKQGFGNTELEPQIVTSANSQKVRMKPARVASFPDGTTGKIVNYKLPDIDLLKMPPKTNIKEREEVLKRNAAILENTLFEFDVEAKVVQINRGPVITMYELEPAVGTKVNKITSLGDNLALAMKSSNIRIVAPLPGKGTIGIEIPNEKSELVILRDTLGSVEYHNEESTLKLALGKDVSGVPIIADLAKMPHLLIAGATGSGKTVCINTIISSLLYNASPDELKLLMVDPKRVELMMFEGIPHLITPIVTNPKKAAAAFSWIIEEMDNRYEFFARKGVRNITAYKERKSPDEEDLPYIVVIVDELADLMMVSQQDVESAIMRLSQLARAAGIHMILATQRPSVNVITGVIKANFSARISFKVASKVDSRTVLDSNGAEKLLGRGDMLFMDPGETSLIRGQCSLVTDGELRDIVKFIKKQAEPQYIEDVITKQEKHANGEIQEKDELYHEALKIIMAARQASVSMIQRKLRVGYSRAARIIDQMEEDGVVGAYNGAKPREILIENLETMEE